MTLDTIVLSRKGFSLVYLNLRLGLAFVCGCHGDDVQATVTVDPVNVGAVFIMRVVMMAAMILPATILSVLIARWMVGEEKINADGPTN